MGLIRFQRTAITLSLIISSASLAMGASRPTTCEVDSAKVDVASLMRSYVPSGSQGRAPAGVVYRTGSQGEILQVIFQKNPDAPQAVASTQKILTAYAAFKRGSLERKVVFSESDLFYDVQGKRALYPGSRREVQVGEALEVLDYIGTMINQSSNGASFAISRGASGTTTEFMRWMNQVAKEVLGPNSKSYFQNPSGLTDSSSSYRFSAPGKQQSTAKELTLLAAKMMSDVAFRKMLESAGVVGAQNGYLTKFGSTQAAGKTVVAVFPLPSSCGNQRISYAFLGSSSSDQFEKYNALTEKLRERVSKNLK